MTEQLSEIDTLKAKIKDLEEKSEFSYGVQVVNLSDKTMIRGVLLAEGVWKGIKYNYDEIKKSATQFLTKACNGDVEHRRTMKYGDRIVGKLTKVIPNDMLRCLMFEAEITDQQAREDIGNKVLDAVSVSGKFDKLNELNGVPEGENYNPVGWTLTGTPACTYATIFNYDLSCLDDKIQPKESLNNLQDSNNIINEDSEILTESNVEVNSKPVETPAVATPEVVAPEVKAEPKVEAKVEEPKTEEKVEAKPVEDKKIEVKVDVTTDMDKLLNGLVEKLKEINAAKPVEEKKKEEAKPEPKVYGWDDNKTGRNLIADALIGRPLDGYVVKKEK